ncbi:MAG: UDP-N-acetylmuramoyl-L-alanine--D-glutamate ligase [Gemmatimonadetes bacterium]|nr:UDP-N-acetylmuramoyl-L-alanine--D-glutamate ligase [Gemmatimonadota bacterium]NNM05903.1 UDP-N-acetylmuramoyl-L-alanine--D-glutamate ligase [Gemmatimonadota bacterium]
MKPLEGSTISILGLGASGAAAARLALIKGGEVYVSDSQVEPSAAAGADELRSMGARVELGRHDLERVAAATAVVVSPGIPPDAPVLQALEAAGGGWVSEPEFAFRFLDGPLIAVTGTNGKTTTASMTAHLLQESGFEVGLGGNIGAEFGPPASGLALLDPVPDWFVVEVSSFQLADTVDFQPSIGVVTSLAPDHLDRYPSVEAYYGDKGRLFKNADSESRWVLNGDSPAVEALAGDAPGERFRFTTHEIEASQLPLETHAFVRGGELFLRLPETDAEPLISARELPTLGRHNVGNALAASLTARLAGSARLSLTEGMKSFQPLPHRLEPVGEAGGLRWVNDSKATNVAATVGALNSLEGPLVLLLGGKDKGEELSPLRRALHAGVRGVVVFGEARYRMAAALGESTELTVADGSFEYAVDAARALAKEGDLLLLSPACSSFDMFPNYQARGDRFSALARGES